MLYWIIPYLVAYNASSSGNWEYGPEHVFKAEVRVTETDFSNDFTGIASVMINFVCRPMNSSLMQCHIKSARINISSPLIENERIGLSDIMFQIEYDVKGISRVWFLNNDDITFHNMIRAIIGTMNMGINIAGKTVGNYVSQEKSIIGTCDTSFVIKNEPLSEVDKQHETEIESYEFNVPSFGALGDDKMIVIEKDRHASECVKKTPYFFGGSEEAYAKAGLRWDEFILTSQSKINLGKSSFSAFTEENGTILFPATNETISVGSRINQLIRVTLESIRAAADDYGAMETSSDAETNFGYGTLWPGSDISEEKLL